jgi:FHS family glucose/mannose:H+ symporter-like MFS transporter
MLLIGALEALYGPSLVRVIDVFDAPPTAVGMIISAHFIGGLLGVLVAQTVHKWIGNRILLGAGYVLLIGGSSGFAWGTTLAFSITGSAIAGLGFGALDYALSHLFAVGFGVTAPRMLNLLHGFFGVGAILAPLVVAVLGVAHYPLYFSGFAALALIAAVGIRGVASRPTQHSSTVDPSVRDAPATPSGQTRLTAVSFGIFTALVGVFVLHVAAGSGIGTWETTYLVQGGTGVEQAAAASSLFWLCMTVSRFVLAKLSTRLRPGVLVTLSCIAMTAGSLLAAIPGFAVAGLAIVGFAIGPVFPTTLAWASQIFGGKRWVSGSLIAISMVGGIVFPPLLGGTVSGGSSLLSFPLFLAAISAFCMVCCLIAGALRFFQAPKPQYTKP